MTGVVSVIRQPYSGRSLLTVLQLDKHWLIQSTSSWSITTNLSLEHLFNYVLTCFLEIMGKVFVCQNGFKYNLLWQRQRLWKLCCDTSVTDWCCWWMNACLCLRLVVALSICLASQRGCVSSLTGWGWTRLQSVSVTQSHKLLPQTFWKPLYQELTGFWSCWI